ncbi:MAG: hypothetical protein U0264_16840 [Candidatus Kapaibacterium sp.]
MRFFLVLIAFLYGVSCAQSAESDKPVQGIVVGASGFEHNYLDIGYCFGRRVNWPSSDMLKGYGGLVIGAEISSQDRVVVAPKLSYSINMFVSFGVNMLYYTDFKTATLQFRPEFGASLVGVRVVFGRNFNVGNYPFTGVNKNNYAITILIPT